MANIIMPTTCEICRGAGTVVDYLHRRGNGWPEIRRSPCPACRGEMITTSRGSFAELRERQEEKRRELPEITSDYAEGCFACRVGEPIPWLLRHAFSFLTFLAELAACLLLLGVLWTIIAGVVMFGGLVYADEGRRWR